MCFKFQTRQLYVSKDAVSTRKGALNCVQFSHVGVVSSYLVMPIALRARLNGVITRLGAGMAAVGRALPEGTGSEEAMEFLSEKLEMMGDHVELNLKI